MKGSTVSIALYGPFSLTGTGGEDLTPRAAKIQALVAMVATARGHRRSRAWLQDRLWSDRAPKQAAGSLRQALLDLKRCLGDDSGILLVTRSTVALDPQGITLKPRPPGPTSESEFLAGIDLRGGPFDEWLREMRNFHATQSPVSSPVVQAPPAPRLTVALCAAGHADPDLAILESFFLDAVQRSLHEYFDIDFTRGKPEEPVPNLIVRVQAIANMARQRWLRASLESPVSLHTHWSDTVQLAENDPPAHDNMACMTLAHRLANALAQRMMDRTIGPAINEADFMAAMALRRMFTMRKDEVDIAESLLKQALARRGRGLYHAWYAQLLSIRHVEQQARDISALSEHCDQHIRLALEAEPTNSNVLASAANARLIFSGDTMQSAALAQQAVTSNRANPLAW